MTTPRRRQAGFGLLLYLIAGIWLVGVLTGLYYRIHHDGYEQGVAEVTALWEEKNREAIERQAEREAAARLTAQTNAAALAEAQAKGRDYETRWRNARNAARGLPLAVCGETPAVRPEGAPGPVSAGPGLALRLTWSFVRQYDAAWTGRGGEPVFSDSTPAAGADPGAASPVGPGEVLDAHAENAARCSADRRSLDALIDQVERLRAGWK